MISVIIPVFNNASTIEELARTIVDTLSDEPLEIIFIDDGSVDDSLTTLRATVSKYPQAKAISLSRNFCQHPATGAGLEHAQGDRIVLMDADLQDRPQNIPLLLAKLVGEVDIVYTIRKDSQKRGFTDITSRLFHFCYSMSIKVPVPDAIGTFRAFNRKVLEALLRYREVNIIYGPLMFYMGFNSDYVHLDRDARPMGKSSYSFFKRFFLAVDALISFTDFPYRFLNVLGAATICGVIIYSGINLVQYVAFGRQLAPGLTVVVLLITFCIGVIMLAVGILGTYLFRIFQEVLARPRYLINEIIEHTSDEETDELDI